MQITIKWSGLDVEELKMMTIDVDVS